MTTWKTSSSVHSRTGRTLPGEDGAAMRGSSAERSIESVRSYSAPSSATMRVKSRPRSLASRNSLTASSAGRTACGGTEFGTHIGDDMAVPGNETWDSPSPWYSMRSCPRPALDPMAAHTSPEITSLAETQGGSSPVSSTAMTCGAAISRRIAGHGHGDFEPADADGEHPQGTGGAGMGVGADESGTRFAEP